ncbi:MAG TPA: PQQ-binding-like beta-propeller repeat protein [Mesotoga sp.]|nr:PQQ-binding-like beta-propeller repeat protein [Mesotoga sp.]
MRRLLFLSFVVLFLLSGCLPIFSPWSWTSRVRGSFQFSSPAMGGKGIVYAATQEDLYAFTHTGKSTSIYGLGSGEWFGGNPSVDEYGNIYIGTTGGRLLKISPEGLLLWSFPSQPSGNYTVRDTSIDGEGNLYFGTIGGTMYCVSPEGVELWHYDTGEEIWSKPAIGEDGTAFFGTLVTGGSETHSFFAIKDGQPLWVFETDAPSVGFYSSPALDGEGNVYVACHDGYLYCLDTLDGSLDWSLRLAPAKPGGDSAIASSPVVGQDGTVYLCTNEGEFYAVSPAGSIQWTASLGTTIFSTPVLSSEGVAYIVGWDDSKLYVVDHDGGVAKRSSMGRNSACSPLMTDDGTLYFTATLVDIGTWSQLVSLETDGTPAGLWPMYGMDQRRTGSLD